MAGCTLPVMSTAGSGNQGICASLPVAAAARRLRIGEEPLLRAEALSQLITIHIKTHIGKLSPLCGCAIAASIGSAAGITGILLAVPLVLCIRSVYRVWSLNRSEWFRQAAYVAKER
jgi:L-cysteine desulfidase